jgi:shikimate kinase
MRIFLNGFMGCGKTTVGKQLADVLYYYYVDLDEFIEEKTYSKVTSLFKQFGEQHFRDVEREYLIDLQVYDRMIVSCGGGTITNQTNLNWMNEHGLTIYLEMPFDEIFNRINHQAEIEKRPLLKNLQGKNFRTEVEKLYQQRIKFYNKCAIKINANEPIEMVVKAIEAAITLNTQKAQ